MTSPASQPDDQTSPPLSLQDRLFVDGLCDQFEQVFDESLEAGFDVFLQKCPGSLHAVAFRDLLSRELELRQERQLKIDASAYSARYPQFAETIGDIVRNIVGKNSSGDDAEHDVPDMLSPTIISKIIPRSNSDRPDPDRPPSVNATNPAHDETIRDSAEATPASSSPPPRDETEESVLRLLQTAKRADSLGRLDHYEVLEVLGRGAFGVVLKAFDEKLHRMVAIKVMNPALAATSPPRQRFLREARSSAAVRHENIVAIYAVEESPFPYLVMEYIPGQTLQQFMDQTGPLDPTTVLKLGQQIAAGLAAAHAQGLIHRDIKPSNILLEEAINPRIKITDFGLARAVDDASLTQSGMIAGTPM